MPSFQSLLNDTASSVELALSEMLEKQGNNLMSDPIRHAVLGGGKRLRAFLVIHSCNIFDVQKETATQTAMAIECLHAYSLVHDDLPCMDDDALRRGKPTVHVKWNEAIATLTGDALQTLAFELIACLPRVDGDRKIELLKKLAKASGMQGMVLGQAQDIQAEKSERNLNLDDISLMQRNKTGALIEWSAIAGAVLSDNSDKELLNYARSIGLAFQIQDDILDIEGDTILAGKRLQKDVSAGKATFVSLLGIENAKFRAKQLVEEAIEALSIYGDKAEPMRQVAKFIIERKL
ncbi:polyprenyl synthetase family protein [Amylibacter sp.]|nr:polyprenyl synthetase family protein [Amylibacter sp.]